MAVLVLQIAVSVLLRLASHFFIRRPLLLRCGVAWQRAGSSTATARTAANLGGLLRESPKALVSEVYQDKLSVLNLFGMGQMQATK